jgi:methionyl aminopeptidase
MIIKKSPEEIDKMAAAGSILVRALALIQGKVREGVTTKDLDAAAEKFIRSQGAEPAFKGYRGFPGSICASPNSMVVHGIPAPTSSSAATSSASTSASSRTAGSRTRRGPSRWGR